METIKLRTKQLEVLVAFQKDKARLTSDLDQVSKNEGLMVELILEEKTIDPATIKNIKLENDSITYELN